MVNGPGRECEKPPGESNRGGVVPAARLEEGAETNLPDFGTTRHAILHPHEAFDHNVFDESGRPRCRRSNTMRREADRCSGDHLSSQLDAWTAMRRSGFPDTSTISGRLSVGQAGKPDLLRKCRAAGDRSIRASW